MSANQSHPIFLALNEMLCSKNLKIKQSSLEKFLNERDAIAPWLAVSGSLLISSWEKIGRDLDFVFEQGILKGGVKPIWKLIRGCLEDQHCSEAVKNGQAMLEMLQEERSKKSEKASSKRNHQEWGELYLDLSELEESNKQLQAIVRRLKKTKLRKRERKKEKGGSKALTPCPMTPSTPPPPYLGGGQGSSGRTFYLGIWKVVRTELRLAYPVFQGPQGNRYEEPLVFKVIKSLAESVKTYGITASFTRGAGRSPE